MGTHPIFESDFDCLTDLLEMAQSVSTKRSCESEISDLFVINLIVSIVSMLHGENQKVLTHVSDDDSRVNTWCHPLDTVLKLRIVTDAKTKRTSNDLLLITFLNLKFL